MTQNVLNGSSVEQASLQTATPQLR